MIALRRVLLAALLLACASCGTSVLVVGEPLPSDGSVDAADADALLDASSVCGPGQSLVYDKPGCDGSVAPVCVGPGDGCAGFFCTCDGRSVVKGCGFSDKPFASFGLCPGDTDAGTR